MISWGESNRPGGWSSGVRIFPRCGPRWRSRSSWISREALPEPGRRGALGQGGPGFPGGRDSTTPAGRRSAPCPRAAAGHSGSRPSGAHARNRSQSRNRAPRSPRELPVCLPARGARVNGSFGLDLLWLASHRGPAEIGAPRRREEGAIVHRPRMVLQPGPRLRAASCPDSGSRVSLGQANCSGSAPGLESHPRVPL